MERLIAPSAIQPGDLIRTADNNVCLVKFVEGPDRIGTYEVGMVDNSGAGKFEIINTPVTIIM
jgi:hypothetical protein